MPGLGREVVTAEDPLARVPRGLTRHVHRARAARDDRLREAVRDAFEERRRVDVAPGHSAAAVQGDGSPETSAATASPRVRTQLPTRRRIRRSAGIDPGWRTAARVTAARRMLPSASM